MEHGKPYLENLSSRSFQPHMNMSETLLHWILEANSWWSGMVCPQELRIWLKSYEDLKLLLHPLVTWEITLVILPWGQGKSMVLNLLELLSRCQTYQQILNQLGLQQQTWTLDSKPLRLIFFTMEWANMAEEGGQIIEGGEKRKGRQSPEQKGTA